MANFCIGENFSEELTCAVCLDSWKDPVELQECQHVLCRDCVKNMVECPICRAPIKSVAAAHRTLVNLAQQVQVKCGRCGWCGTREQSAHHVCDPNKVDEVARQQQQFYSHDYANTNAACSNNNNNNSGSGGAAATAAPAATQTYNNYNNTTTTATTASPSRPSLPMPFNAYTTAGRPSGTLSQQQQQLQQLQQQQQQLQQQQQQLQLQQQQQQQQQQQRTRRRTIIEPTGPTPWVLYNMTQVEYDQVVSLFVYFDSDESGRLDRQEVSRLARWLNFAQSDEDIRRLFNDMDSDHNGSLSLGEFLTWLRDNRPNPDALYGLTQAQYNTIMMQFHTYDTDRDGYLGVEDFTRLVMNIGDVRDIAKGHRLFQMIDREQTGHVSLHDFLRFRAGRV